MDTIKNHADGDYHQRKNVLDIRLDDHGRGGYHHCRVFMDTALVRTNGCGGRQARRSRTRGDGD